MKTWLELSICTPGEYVEPLSEVFRKYGDAPVVIEESGDWDPDRNQVRFGSQKTVIVRTYLHQDHTYKSRRSMIDVGVRLVALIAPLGELQEKVIKDTDWIKTSQAYHGLLRIGRLVIKPSWHKYELKSSEIMVKQDPGMAFGTGHHPTTRRCLEALEQRITKGMKILDLGTGSGILSIASVKLGASLALAVDDDREAVNAANKNARANGVNSQVKVIHGTIPDSRIAVLDYDLIVANVTAQVIIKKAESLLGVLSKNGLLVLSGILKEHLAIVLDVLASLDSVVVEEIVDGDWITLLVKKT